MKLCAPKRGRSPNVGAHNLPLRGNTNISYSPERKLFMAKHLNPLEKEFLIRKFKGGAPKLNSATSAGQTTSQRLLSRSG